MILILETVNMNRYSLRDGLSRLKRTNTYIEGAYLSGA
jgi:hypothetical protein